MLISQLEPGETKMKTVIMCIAAAACFAASASAQQVVIDVPKDLSAPGAQTAYVAALKNAVHTVCARKFMPIGERYYAYQACVVATTKDLIASEPTGALAASLGGRRPVAVASS